MSSKVHHVGDQLTAGELEKLGFLVALVAVSISCGVIAFKLGALSTPTFNFAPTPSLSSPISPIDTKPYLDAMTLLKEPKLWISEETPPPLPPPPPGTCPDPPRDR